MSYRPHVDVKKLGRNTKVVAEALARVIYNLTEKVNAQLRKFIDTRHYVCFMPVMWHCCCSCSTQGAPGDLQIFTEQMVSHFNSTALNLESDGPLKPPLWCRLNTQLQKWISVTEKTTIHPDESWRDTTADSVDLWQRRKMYKCMKKLKLKGYITLYHWLICPQRWRPTVQF